MTEDGSQVIVFGGNGMLGCDLMRVLEDRGMSATGLDLPDTDITRYEQARDAVRDHHAGLVINVAAFTNVDGCESQEEQAFAVNATGAGNIARACAEQGACMVHISTDYVFDGRKGSPYTESDPVNPLSAYGRGKAEGEELVRRHLPEGHLIVRTQALYGLHGHNFVEAILRKAAEVGQLRVVNDQRVSPTYTRDLAEALGNPILHETKGTLHVSNIGEATWFEFAKSILERSGMPDIPVDPITTAELALPAHRPACSVLSNERYISLTGRPLRSWEEALEDYLTRRAQHRTAH